MATTKKNRVQSVQRVCWEQKRAQIAIFWGKEPRNR
jgi:hypothetical protein